MVETEYFANCTVFVSLAHIVYLAEKGNLRKCKKFGTTCLISYANKQLLRAISNIIKCMQTPVGRTSRFLNWDVEQIANVRIQNEKYTNHKMGTYHNFMDSFKGALYRIQILCRRYAFWSYPAVLTIADPPG